jgi:hypothetical protein
MILLPPAPFENLIYIVKPGNYRDRFCTHRGGLSPAAIQRRGRRRVAVPMYKKTVFVSSAVSLCLSRACLGEKIAFMYKWLKKTGFAYASPPGIVYVFPPPPAGLGFVASPCGNVSLSLNFSCVCPEPVLVNRRFPCEREWCTHTKSRFRKRTGRAQPQ